MTITKSWRWGQSTANCSPPKFPDNPRFTGKKHKITGNTCLRVGYSHTFSILYGRIPYPMEQGILEHDQGIRTREQGNICGYQGYSTCPMPQVGRCPSRESHFASNFASRCARQAPWRRRARRRSPDVEASVEWPRPTVPRKKEPRRSGASYRPRCRGGVMLQVPLRWRGSKMETKRRASRSRTGREGIRHATHQQRPRKARANCLPANPARNSPGWAGMRSGTHLALLRGKQLSRRGVQP